jgi:hypothetical protein
LSNRINPVELEALKPFANPTQAAYIDAVLAFGGVRPAAVKLGIDHSSIAHSIRRVRATAARRGWAPTFDMSHPAPPGYSVKGTTTLYGPEGQLLQWVKTRQDDIDRLDQFREAAQILAEPFQGIYQPGYIPQITDADLLTVYPMGDPHIGMYSWAAETGEDFDLHIAETTLCGAVDRLVRCAPASNEALIVNLGDFFHADNQDSVTRRSGHSLDVDTRWGKVLQVGIRIMQRMIESALQKHQTVRVVSCIGNHDDHSALMLSAVLAAFYAKEPRVEVEISPAAFHWHRHGAVLIGMTHGDKIKPEQLGQVMATDQPKAWGDTVHRYWYTGHIHTRRMFEMPGCLVESFRTLAARDAWAASMGYRSGRDMHCIIHHRQHGEVERHRVDIGQLCAAAA